MSHHHHEESGTACREEYEAPRFGPGFGPRTHMRRFCGRPRMWELIPTREEQIALLESAKANLERDLDEIEKRLADLRGDAQA